MVELTYSDYLHLDELLSLQHPRSPGGSDRALLLAEHFFIVAHQAGELWMSQILSDLAAGRDEFAAARGEPDAELGMEHLDRATRILTLQHAQLLVLERLPLRHFAEFRPHLHTASGAQSAQFLRLDSVLADDQHPDSLYQAFAGLVGRQGLTVADVCRRGVGAGVLHRVAEALIELGNTYWRWKAAHMGLMSATLGDRSGTGGTNGLEYLRSRLYLPFAELRRLRGDVHDWFLTHGLCNASALGGPGTSLRLEQETTT